MSFGLSPSLRFRGSRYAVLRAPLSSYAPLSLSLFHDVCLSHAGAPNSTSPEFKERSARERETDFERFLEVGGEKLKAPQAGNADSEFSLGGDTERGGAMRLEVFEIVCRASRNINRA